MKKIGFVLLGVVLLGLLGWMSIPVFEEARSRSSMNACVQCMKLIEGAKAQVALRDGLVAGEPMDTEEMKARVHELLDEIPTCYEGGRYSYNPVGVTPTCSLENPKERSHMVKGYPLFENSTPMDTDRTE